LIIHILIIHSSDFATIHILLSTSPYRSQLPRITPY